MNDTKDIKDIIEIYGINPEKIGRINCGWWVVDKIDEEENNACAEIGDLCVKSQDGGCNPIDDEAMKIENFVGTSNGCFTRTYRYYYYQKIKDVK